MHANTFPRSSLLVLLILVALTGCQTTVPLIVPLEVAACPPNCGYQNKNSPVAEVTLVRGQMVVNPMTLYAWDLYAPKKQYPVTVQWIAPNENDVLKVWMKGGDQKCLKRIDCVGRFCTADTKEQPPAPKQGTSCTYGVSLNGVEMDPVVIVQPCC